MPDEEGFPEQGLSGPDAGPTIEMKLRGIWERLDRLERQVKDLLRVNG